MEGLQKAWGNMVQGFLASLGHLWERLARGVLQDWDVRVFVFAMALILLTGLFSVWKKKI